MVPRSVCSVSTYSLTYILDASLAEIFNFRGYIKRMAKKKKRENANTTQSRDGRCRARGREEDTSRLESNRGGSKGVSTLHTAAPCCIQVLLLTDGRSSRERERECVWRRRSVPDCLGCPRTAPLDCVWEGGAPFPRTVCGGCGVQSAILAPAVGPKARRRSKKKKKKR